MDTAAPLHMPAKYSPTMKVETDALMVLAMEVQHELGELKKETKALEAEKKRDAEKAQEKPDNISNGSLASFKKEYLSTKELLEIIPICKRTLQNYRDKGEIPFDRVAGKIFYSKSAILKWLKTNKLKTGKMDV